MDRKYFDWEKNVERLDKEIDELRVYGKRKGIDYSADIGKLEERRNKKLGKLYEKLSSWQTVGVARHPDRPVMKDYLENMVRDFREMHGDEYCGDDGAIVCGFGRIGRYKVMVVGHNKDRRRKLSKGASKEESLEYLRLRGGYPNPEGFRKALAKMELAEKFGIPIVTLIDTPGAYPGIGAEERGVAKAIAVNLKYMTMIRVPIVSVLVGEGGSGGALGLCGGANKFGALEHSWYSVISPEGCAAILFKDGSMGKEAAKILKLSAKEGKGFGAIDDIIDEGLGGAHRNHYETFEDVKKYIVGGIGEFVGMSGDELVAQRIRMIGQRAGGNLEKKRGWFS